MGLDLLNEWALTCRNNPRGRGNNGLKCKARRWCSGRPSVAVNNARFTNNVPVRPAIVSAAAAAGPDVGPLNVRLYCRVCAMRVDPEIAFIYGDIGDSGEKRFTHQAATRPVEVIARRRRVPSSWWHRNGFGLGYRSDNGIRDCVAAIQVCSTFDIRVSVEGKSAENCDCSFSRQITRNLRFIFFSNFSEGSLSTM